MSEQVKVVITVTEADGKVREATYWRASSPIISTAPTYRSKAAVVGTSNFWVGVPEEIEHLDVTVTFRAEPDPVHDGDVAFYNTKEHT